MLQARLGLSQRRACTIVGQHRSTQRHTPAEPDADAQLRCRLRGWSADHPRWGYRRAHHCAVRDAGWLVNRKKIQRLWREEGLRVPPKRRKRRRLGESTMPADRLRATHPDHVWALDYQFEELAQVLASAPSDFTQRNLQLMVQAYRRREISEMLRCSVKTIESRPARHWSRVRAC